jgi:hypothetical protein
MSRILASNSSSIIGMAAQEKKGWVGWENHGRKINGPDYQDVRN